MKKEKVVILHNIRSVYNVGSIFRTADGAGVSKIYLTGYTPKPHDKFGRDRKDLTKVALGAEKSVPWERTENIFEVIKFLKGESFQIVAVEQSQESINYKKLKVGGKQAFVFGSETEGLPPNILRESDVIAEVPMKGEKKSLNVAVTAGIILFLPASATGNS